MRFPQLLEVKLLSLSRSQAIQIYCRVNVDMTEIFIKVFDVGMFNPSFIFFYVIAFQDFFQVWEHKFEV